MTNHILLILTSIGLLTLACQWLAWWLRLPAILFLLLTGLTLGPGLHWINPDALLGDLLTPFILLSVAVILFEGSLTLNLQQIQALRPVIRNLVTVGMLVTAALAAVFSHVLMSFDWATAAMFGAIICVTGPTVITPMIRSVRPNAKIANVLRWEGIVVDPIGAILAVLTYSVIAAVHGNTTFVSVLLHVFEIIVVAGVFGVATGYWLGRALARHWIPEYLHNVATLMIVIGVFTLANRVNEGSGLLAVTLMGIWLANMNDVPVKELINFKESLSILLISGLFIVLAARIELTHIGHLWGPALLLLLSLQFIVRPASVFISTLNSKLNWRERTLLGWIAPRGIIAAAVAALFALRLHQLNIGEDASHLILVVFLMIIGTVLLQSLTAKPLAQWLQVADPEPRGALIIGANRVARAIALALQQHQFRVVLTAINWECIQAARMAGLETYFGNPVSAHADRNLDLVGIGYLLALTPQSDLNALSTIRYKKEFGRNKLFVINNENVLQEKYAIDKQHRGQLLFGESITFEKLDDLFAHGATIRSTSLTETFDYDAYYREHPNAIPLFALDARGKLQVFNADRVFQPAAGWTVISVFPDSSPR